MSLAEASGCLKTSTDDTVSLPRVLLVGCLKGNTGNGDAGHRSRLGPHTDLTGGSRLGNGVWSDAATSNASGGTVDIVASVVQ